MINKYNQSNTCADLNCILEGLVPTGYYAKTTKRLSSTNGGQMNIKYRLPNVRVCIYMFFLKERHIIVQKVI